jgi:integrase
MSVYRDPRSPYWHFDFQWRGRRFHGSTKATTRREAEAVERSEREKAKQHVAQLQAARTSLGACSRNTWKRLSLLIEHFGKDKLITDITDDDVVKLVAWRRGHRVRNGALISPATLNLTIMALKTLFATLRPRVREPEWRRHWLPVRQEHPRELVGDEAERLEAATRDDYAPLFALAMATGLRQSECLLLVTGRFRRTADTEGRQGRQSGHDADHADDPRNPLAAARASSRARVHLCRTCSPMSQCAPIAGG